MGRVKKNGAWFFWGEWKSYRCNITEWNGLYKSFITEISGKYRTNVKTHTSMFKKRRSHKLMFAWHCVQYRAKKVDRGHKFNGTSYIVDTRQLTLFGKHWTKCNVNKLIWLCLNKNMEVYILTGRKTLYTT
jgi:hypothetical protein